MTEPTDARVRDPLVRLAASTRALIEAVAVGGRVLDDATLTAAADAIDAVSASLAADAPPAEIDPRRTDRLHWNMLVGDANPLSPAAEYTFADGVLTARARFGAAHEGPPGWLHGGIVAQAFDALLGLTAWLNGQPSMTARLSVRYRKPTPLHTDLVLTAWIGHHEGRRMRAHATLYAGDELTAEAEGLFVRVRPETEREYFDP